MKTPRQKITANQQNHLLQVYLHMGQGPAGELATEYGVSSSYAASHASQLGLSPLGGKFRGSGKVSSAVDHADPRWARAIKIGAVIA